MKFLAIYNNIETDGDSAPLTVEEVLDEIEAKQRALQGAQVHKSIPVSCEHV